MVKRRLLTLLLIVFSLSAVRCGGGGGDDGLGNFLLLFLLTQSAATGAAGPNFELLESTTTAATLQGANYYGAGIAGYSSSAFSFNLLGLQNPSVIVQAEQNHAIGGGYIDFLQSFSGGTFFTRNAPSAAQSGSVLHWYGRNTTLYTTPSVSLPPTINGTGEFRAVAPSNSLPVTIRRIRALNAASLEESSFTVDSTTADHSQRGMGRVWSTEKRIRFHLIFLDGSNPAASESGIATAIARLTELYVQNTVRIRPVVSSTTLNAPAYLNLNSLSGDSTAAGSLGGLFANTATSQRTDAVNIYFVKSETAVGGVLGVSGGIPGLPGKAGTRMSAMVVMFDSHLAAPGVAPDATEQQLLGETIAHEAGHWLGLWHPVESNYDTTQNIYTRDAISETPRCTQAGVGLAACDGTAENNSGARNVMFWTGTAGFLQSRLTGEQGWVLRRHPLAF